MYLYIENHSLNISSTQDITLTRKCTKFETSVQRSVVHMHMRIPLLTYMSYIVHMHMRIPLLTYMSYCRYKIPISHIWLDLHKNKDLLFTCIYQSLCWHMSYCRCKILISHIWLDLHKRQKCSKNVLVHVTKM